jgi:hypothetical protein
MREKEGEGERERLKERKRYGVRETEIGRASDGESA